MEKERYAYKGWIILSIVTAIAVVVLAIEVGILWGKYNKLNDAIVATTDDSNWSVVESPAVQEEFSTEIPVQEESPTEIPVTKSPVEQVITNEPEKTVNEEAIVREEIEPIEEHETELEIMYSDPSGGEPAEILQIREWFQNTENSLNSLSKEKDNGATCYRNASGIVKIRLEAGYNGNNEAREYFYKDAQLYFVNILTATPAGDRFYYVNGKVIRYSNPSEQDFYNDQISPHMGLAFACMVEGSDVFWKFGSN